MADDVNNAESWAEHLRSEFETSEHCRVRLAHILS
jgi:hypothetical protein